jgi:hypothetical protein
VCAGVDAERALPVAQLDDQPAAGRAVDGGPARPFQSVCPVAASSSSAGPTG